MFVHGPSPVHRLPSKEKLVALLLFVTAVVATPPHQVWAFAVYGVVLSGVASMARLPPLVVARRLSFGVPFLLFACALPFIGGGAKIPIGLLSISLDGAWAAWAIVTKGMLCLGASVIVTATTPVSEVLNGLSALRVPGIFVAIGGFMVRYIDTIASEARRMRVAMVARGHRPRWIGHSLPHAGAAGSLFVRAYERGERVYGAMVVRGYVGGVPGAIRATGEPSRWWVTETPSALASLVCVGALLIEAGAFP
jgi:cobalt/nickel transport system permease protein